MEVIFNIRPSAELELAVANELKQKDKKEVSIAELLEEENKEDDKDRPSG